MTQEQQHPITPPLELVEQWRMSAPRARDCGASAERWIVWAAAAWFRNQYQPKIQAAADQELEACLRYAGDNGLSITRMRAARRPERPTLKEEALEAWEIADQTWTTASDKEVATIIRRAIEALP
jgi:hypothetical protein